MVCHVSRGAHTVVLYEFEVAGVVVAESHIRVLGAPVHHLDDEPHHDE